MKTTEAIEIAGTLSEPSKMPAFSYGLPAEECLTGSKLVNVAGSTCSKCYALKGFYRTYARTIKPAQYKRLDAIQNRRWAQAMVVLISAAARKSEFFRWHDSGDLQSVTHLGKIARIAEALPHVKFWLPTREYGIVRQFMSQRAVPSNLTIRLSAQMIDGAVPNNLNRLPVSMVHSTDKPTNGAYECPARYQGNACGSCRACWDSTVTAVSYHQH